MRILFMLISVAAIFTFCRKKELKFTINGVVSDASFSGTSQGVKVKLFVTPLGESEDLVGTATTSTDGVFEFVIDRERIEKVRLTYNKINYFEEEQIIYFSNLEVNEDNDASQSLTAKSWVRFQIFNQSPASASDEFKLFKYRGKEDCAECCPIGNSYYYGAVDTAVICPNGANSYTSYYYWVTNTQIYGQDSVFTTPFDTVTVNFVY